MSFFKNLNFEKLKQGLSKTRDKVVNSVTELVTGKAVIDEKTLEEVEEILLTSDIGYDIVETVIDSVRKELKKQSERDKIDFLNILKSELAKALKQYENEYKNKIETSKPFVLMVVGVNGVGKTTTIGKLAHNFKSAGLSVVIGSADTFRAAANDQLEIWAERAGVDIIQKKQGADPSAVVYDTLDFAVKNKKDIVLIDTAGRLHTKVNLMEELKKIKRTMAKICEHAPDEVWLVVDATTGQNAIIQAKEFAKVTEISGLVVSKLDGTAKGGVVFQICKQQKIPIRYIGVGEGIDDLQDFEAESFVDALFQ